MRRGLIVVVVLIALGAAAGALGFGKPTDGCVVYASNGEVAAGLADYAPDSKVVCAAGWHVERDAGGRLFAARD